MPKISGSLLFVSSRAAQVSEVWVRAPRVRTHAEGVVTTGNDRFPVTGGEVSFSAVPGPAVLVLISQGRAVDTIPIVVGEGESQSLQDVVRAAQVVDDSTQREIERLSAEMMDALGAARTEAESASGFAARAGESADEAAASASEAAESASGAATSESAAARYAEQAGGHASAAFSSASRAATSEQNAAKSAGDADASATQAEESATSAKQDADRAANIADSTSWDGDKLTVNGKTSPSLRGPKGDRGEAGQDGKDGASAWKDITGKPSTFPPSTHTHKMADISDMPTVSDFVSNRTIVQRSEAGTIRAADPQGPNNVATQKYVDSVGNTKADKSHKHTVADISDLPEITFGSTANSLVQRDRNGSFYAGEPTYAGHVANKRYVDSRIKLVSSLPSSPEFGVLYVITE